ncbi:MAG: imidazolonepropionase [Aestuariivita sp.]|nr:imidazolonepropionase [Aestuariivita sp.]
MLHDIVVATLTEEVGYGIIKNACIVIDGKKIAWVGPEVDLPENFSRGERHSLNGRLVTPALIDCHTHIIFNGNRAKEFEMRLKGASYEEIARAGGGIISTVQATRDATEEELLTEASTRADTLIAEGVTTVEIKSGYGLDTETELKILRVARAVEDIRQIRVYTSFLGAHAVPPGTDADIYIDDICIPTLRRGYREGLVDAVDGFCERIAFTPAQIERVFQAASDVGLPVKLHAEQLSNLGGAQLAARYGALSVDHLEYADETDVRAMAKAGSVAVLLPGAFYTLHESKRPPVKAFREQNVPMAVATDWNPGSSPLGSVLLAMNMAATLFGLTPAETLAGTTRHAARTLGLTDCGQVAPGMRADLCVWDITSPAELSYRIGQNPLHMRIFEGAI